MAMQGCINARACTLGRLPTLRPLIYRPTQPRAPVQTFQNRCESVTLILGIIMMA